MQVYINGDEVNIDKQIMDADEVDIIDIMDCIGDIVSDGTIIRVEIDDEGYIPGDAADKTIDTDEVERLNFITGELFDSSEDVLAEARETVPELRKSLKNAASEFMLGDEEKAWDMFMDAGQELNRFIEELTDVFGEKAELLTSEEFIEIKKEHQNTDVLTMTANNLFRQEADEAAESAEEMAEVAEKLEEFICEDK
ncbi:hypothetical protein [Halarsenatibacter silvermanii]|uniref:Uncharacterized protein n=1 Tax=Halarsenatibacter silvermanii TaxID=321763 RepID=A0A1G9M3E0_9FIRM|nr:hypothetical protein [Halarsenatibacter silvermanii]SDL68205.1 hypothetical protein SAMN04488692_10780 [Halarsenatibacter silvermanii]